MNAVMQVKVGGVEEEQTSPILLFLCALLEALTLCSVSVSGCVFEDAVLSGDLHSPTATPSCDECPGGAHAGPVYARTHTQSRLLAVSDRTW